MPKPEILFGNQGKVKPDRKADWTMAFRNQNFLSTGNLISWVVIVPDREGANLDGLMTNLVQVGRPLNFKISDPLEKLEIVAPNPRSYSNAIRRAMAEHGNGLNLVFVIITNNKLDNYASVKQSTFTFCGIPSQCFLAVIRKGLMPIGMKEVKMLNNAKLGGQPWSVKIPLKNTMVCGFDVYHTTAGQAVGAMCATLDGDLTKYFSTFSYHSSNQELSTKVNIQFKKCLKAYLIMNNILPQRIVFYRDGVGEGQLPYVYEQELKKIKVSIDSVYARADEANPFFTFIVVSKRINSRIFAKTNRIDNPMPGTALPERYDFFCLPFGQLENTVTPSGFVVLADSSRLPPIGLQQLTHSFISGTMGVPAPVHYAHKLALLIANALSSGAHRAAFVHYL